LAQTSWIFGFGFLAAAIAFAGADVVGRTMKFAQSRIPPKTWTPFRSLRISTGLLIGIPIVLFVVFVVHSQTAFVRPEDNATAKIHLPILRNGYPDYNPDKHSIFVAMDMEGEIAFQIRKGAVTEGGEPSDVVSWMNENTPKERTYAIRFAADRRTPFVDLLEIVNRLPSDRIVNLGILGTNDGMRGDYLDILKECRYPPKPGEEDPKIDVRLFVMTTGGEGVYDLHHREPGKGSESQFTRVLKAEKDVKKVMKAMKKCFGDSQRNVLVELDETADVGSVVRAWEILYKLNAVYFRTVRR
jgi:biopolymer transport protein ExbD